MKKVKIFFSFGCSIWGLKLESIVSRVFLCLLLISFASCSEDDGDFGITQDISDGVSLRMTLEDIDIDEYKRFINDKRNKVFLKLYEYEYAINIPSLRPKMSHEEYEEVSKKRNIAMTKRLATTLGALVENGYPLNKMVFLFIQKYEEDNWSTTKISDWNKLCISRDIKSKVDIIADLLGVVVNNMIDSYKITCFLCYE